MVVLFMIIILSPTSLKALQMESQRYLIESEDVSISTDEQTISESGFPLSNSEKIEFEKNGYIITSKPSESFSFSLEKSNLDFPGLSPNKPSTATNKLSASSTSGYQINIVQQTPLTSLTGDAINQTTCNDKCSNIHASIWTDNSKTGIGYTIKGDDFSEDFKNINFFKAFAQEIKKQKPVSVMGNSGTKNISEAELIIKIIPTANNTDIYNGVVQFQALPNF